MPRTRSPLDLAICEYERRGQLLIELDPLVRAQLWSCLSPPPTAPKAQARLLFHSRSGGGVLKKSLGSSLQLCGRIVRIVNRTGSIKAASNGMYIRAGARTPSLQRRSEQCVVATRRCRVSQRSSPSPRFPPPPFATLAGAQEIESKEPAEHGLLPGASIERGGPVCGGRPYYRLPLARLWVVQSIWQFLAEESPPLLQAVTWSASISFSSYTFVLLASGP